MLGKPESGAHRVELRPYSPVHCSSATAAPASKAALIIPFSQPHIVLCPVDRPATCCAWSSHAASLMRLWCSLLPIHTGFPLLRVLIVLHLRRTSVLLWQSVRRLLGVNLPECIGAWLLPISRA